MTGTKRKNVYFPSFDDCRKSNNYVVILITRKSTAKKAQDLVASKSTRNKTISPCDCEKRRKNLQRSRILNPWSCHETSRLFPTIYFLASKKTEASAVAGHSSSGIPGRSPPRRRMMTGCSVLSENLQACHPYPSNKKETPAKHRDPLAETSSTFFV